MTVDTFHINSEFIIVICRIKTLYTTINDHILVIDHYLRSLFAAFQYK